MRRDGAIDVTGEGAVRLDAGGDDAEPVRARAPRRPPPIVEALREDARFTHRLRFPGRQPTWLTMARVLLGSRGLLLVAEHRLEQAARRWSPRGPAGRAARNAARAATFVLGYLVSVVTKSDLRPDSDLEGGVCIAGGGHVFLGPRTIGRGTVIHAGVTIGWGVRHGGLPTIGPRVWIGPDCVIAGNITVGEGTTILPHTVLTKSIPAGALVQGNPARVIRRDFDNAALRASLSTDVGSLIEAPRTG